MGVHQGMHTKISSETHPANTDDNHNTCDTSDEDPRPAKRRKPRSAPAVTAPLHLRQSPPACRIPPPASRLMTRSPKLIADIGRPWSMTNNSTLHDLLEVPLLRQSRYQLLCIRSGPSKDSSNAPRSGMRQRIISNSNCHVSQSTSNSQSRLRSWALVLIQGHPQRLKPPHSAVAHF